ncbi:MAG: TonB C-terminal domain-containing protein [Acidobacteriota bacterium]
MNMRLSSIFKAIISSCLKAIPSRKEFSIFHATILALFFHFLFLLFFQDIASAFFEPIPLYKMKPPEKEIKFTLVDKKEEMRREEKPKEIQKKEIPAREFTEKKVERVLIPDPERMIPAAREETRDLIAGKVPLFAPDRSEAVQMQKQDAGKVDPGIKQEGTVETRKEGKTLPGEIPPENKKERSRTPVIRKDLFGDLHVTPPASAQGSGQPHGASINYDSGFSPNLSFETKDFNWTDYASAIYIAIWRSWHNRLYLTLGNFERWSIENNSPGINSVTGVTFVIERNGNISEIALLYSSSIEPLDASAIDALKEAILPPLPSHFPKERERVTARFIAETSIKAMRYWLPIYKYYGYF